MMWLLMTRKGNCSLGVDSFALIGVLFDGTLEEDSTNNATDFLETAWNYLPSDSVTTSETFE